MSKHSFPFYKEQLEMILAVTNMLNENGSKLPESEGFYFKVQLVESGGHTVIGEWSDEISDTDWEFSLVEEKPKITQQQMLMHNGVAGARAIIDADGDTHVIRRTIAERAQDNSEALRIQKYELNHGNVQLD